MTYHIRVRAEYVGYYTIEADNLDKAEVIARDRCTDEMIGNGMDLQFDYEIIDEQETIDVMFDSDGESNVKSSWSM